MTARRGLLGAGALAALVAVLAEPAAAHAALRQAWPPFVLVAGLLLVGLAAGADGVFEAAGARIERLPLGGSGLLGACLALVAVTTALLNLDTAVVFLTPVLVHAARRRRLPVTGFLYGCVLMANASSLFLPGANLTNLLVLSGEHISGATFFVRMAPAALTAALVTALGLVAIHRRALVAGPSEPADDRAPAPLRGVVGVTATVVAGMLLLVIRQPALPVAAVGLIAVAVQIARRRTTREHAWRAVDPPVLAGLLGISVALGTLARSWSGPSRLLRGASRAGTAAVGALAAIALNNLPASVLLSAGPVPHPRALLLGVGVGPNLAVTGSLSVFLWAQAARSVDCEVSAARYSRLGAPLAVVAIAAALAATALFGSAT